MSTFISTFVLGTYLVTYANGSPPKSGVAIFKDTQQCEIANSRLQNVVAQQSKRSGIEFMVQTNCQEVDGFKPGVPS